MEGEDSMVHLGLLGVRVKKEPKVDTEVLLGYLGHPDRKESQVREDHKDQPPQEGEEQLTLAGVGPPAPLVMELSLSMLAELVGHLSHIQGERQISYVYQRILTIFSSREKYKEFPSSVKSSIGLEKFNLSLLLTITMFPVLCAMCPPEVWQ